MPTLQAITIDPPGAKDLDDAVWVEEAHGGWVVTVCIANVTEHVRHHSVIDVTARTRLATHYYRDGNRPMLPRNFAEDRTSLLPRAPRPVVVLRAGVTRAGEVGSARVFLGYVASAAQLTYADVPHLLREGGPHASMLMDAERCTHALLCRRRAGGALVHYDPEQGLALTEEGAFKRLDHRNVVGYRIVHELMLMTNRALAEFAHANHVPILYRNHKSAADRSSLLLTLAEVLDRPNVALEEYRRSIGSKLQRAEYGATSQGHFALNVERYCHATSPIRRYADLVTQRQIVAHVSGHPLPYSQGDLQRLADEINTTLRSRETVLSEEMKGRANRRAIRMIENIDKPMTPADLERDASLRDVEQGHDRRPPERDDLPPGHMSAPTLIEVELHSTDPEAVRATRQTIEALPGGSLVEREGRFFVPTGFVEWACVHQGYVKHVVPPTNSIHPT